MKIRSGFLTPIRGLVVPWLFLRGDYDRHGTRWVRERVRRLAGPLWLVVVYRRQREKSRYRERALEWLRHYVDVRDRTVEVGRDEVTMTICRSLQDESYVGPPDDAHRFICRYGIERFYAPPGCKVAAVGRTGDGRWYGWPHRAIFGFRPGEPVENVSLLPGYEVGYVPVTEADARRLATVFAESVS